MERGIAVGLTALVSMGVGIFVGRLIAVKQLEKQFEAKMAEEVEATRVFYAKMYKKDEFETPEKAAEALKVEPAVREEVDEVILPPLAAKVLSEYKGETVNYGVMASPAKTDIPAKDVEVTLNNVFNRPEKTWEELLRDRTEDAPYIISVEEYMENAEGFRQLTLSYFAGDGVLADDGDQPVDVALVIGDYNISRFGFGSGNPNTLYVRNHVLEIDYEIVLSQGKYKVEVAGLEDD